MTSFCQHGSKPFEEEISHPSEY